jgi:hypothetical protein
MEKVIETKTAVVAKSSSGSTAVLFAAFIDGEPTMAQIETARYTIEANLENVGATNTSSYLLRHKKVDLAAGESLLLTVDSTYSKISPDPLPETLDENAPEPETSEV